MHFCPDPPFARKELGVIDFNVVPQCMGFTESGYTVEELKLRDEPRKILGLP